MIFPWKYPSSGSSLNFASFDGKYIFNYLHFPENNIILNDYYLSCEDFISELIDYCIEQINKNTKYKIIDKYFYT